MMKSNHFSIRKLSFLLCLLSFLLSSPVSVQAQTNPLRDSLAVATANLDQHTDSVDLRLKRAAWYLLLENWTGAKDDYDLILRRDPNNISALFYRAYVNERLGRYGFARLDYNNLIKLVPGNFEAQLGLALLNQKDKHYTEALDGINSLVEQYPDNAIAYAARAGIEQERGMLMLAEYDFSQAIQRDPKNIDYILQRMDVYILENKWENVKRDLTMLRDMGAPMGELKPYYDKLAKAKK